MLSGSRVSVLTAPDDALCCARRCRRRRSATSARRCATRCASRSPARRSRRSRPAAARRRSSSSRPRCRCRARRSIPARRRSRPTIGELERLGVPSQRQTLLVAGGLGRRAGQPGARGAARADGGPRASGVASRCTTAESRRARQRSGSRAAPSSASTRTSSRPTSSSPSRRPRRCCTAAREPSWARSARTSCGARAPTRCSRPRPRRGWQVALALERALANRVPVLGTVARAQPTRD